MAENCEIAIDYVLPVYAENANISDGFKCALCKSDSERSFYNWRQLWGHTRHAHGLTTAQFPADNVLLRKYREEENAARKTRRRENPEQNAEANRKRREHWKRRRSLGDGALDAETPPSKKIVIGTDWVVRPCYVKIDSCGEVAVPLQAVCVKGPCQTGPPCSVGTVDLPAVASDLGQPVDTPECPSSSGYEGKAPTAMVTEMYLDFKEKQQQELQQQNWKDKIPSVHVKHEYVIEQAPACKRDGAYATSACQVTVGRGTWPKKLANDKVTLNDFKQYGRGTK